MLKLLGAMALVLALTGCKSSPGPLEGSWRSTGAVPVTITFSPGQVESNGVVEPVAYEESGSEVTVTQTEGMAKGTTTLYVIKSSNSMEAMGHSYRKVSAP